MMSIVMRSNFVRNKNKLKDLIGEFTDHILYDKTRKSFLVNFKKKWFKPLNSKMVKNRYSLIFKSLISNTYTCVYKHLVD